MLIVIIIIHHDVFSLSLSIYFLSNTHINRARSRDDQEIFAGDFLSKIIVPHPGMDAFVMFVCIIAN
jgi:hypothetical protein